LEKLAAQIALTANPVLTYKEAEKWVPSDSAQVSPFEEAPFSIDELVAELAEEATPAEDGEQVEIPPEEPLEPPRQWLKSAGTANQKQPPKRSAPASAC
jgi:hypothetical protein